MLLLIILLILLIVSPATSLAEAAHTFAGPVEAPLTHTPAPDRDLTSFPFPDNLHTSDAVPAAISSDPPVEASTAPDPPASASPGIEPPAPVAAISGPSNPGKRRRSPSPTSPTSEPSAKHHPVDARAGWFLRFVVRVKCETQTRFAPTRASEPSPLRGGGGGHAGRGSRAASYKKAQDLYSKNKRVLADKILSGKSLLDRDIYPPINTVEALYSGPVTDRMQTFRYLGHFFGLSGAAKPTVYNLSRWLKCVEAAPLKPEQKLSLIRDTPPQRDSAQDCGGASPHSQFSDQGPAHRPSRPEEAVHLRTANLATKGQPTVQADQRRCRAGCNRVESLSHVLQGCPRHNVTHYERIGRHNEIANKIATHARRRGFTVEKEPRIYHADKQLFIPDLAIHLPIATHARRRGFTVEKEPRIYHADKQLFIPDLRRRGFTVEKEPRIYHADKQLFIPDLAIHLPDKILVTDVQVCWEGPRPLSESWTSLLGGSPSTVGELDKEEVGLRPSTVPRSCGAPLAGQASGCGANPAGRKRCLAALQPSSGRADRRWPGRPVVVEPILLGARGVWPRCNHPAAALIAITTLRRAGSTPASSGDTLYTDTLWQQCGGTRDDGILMGVPFPYWRLNRTTSTGRLTPPKLQSAQVVIIQLHMA
ncbi:hypothetical protein QE152_g30550 [Popillia japonica]|uniref:Reverse transcriptase n=1 Tax=Popillia japonica TaxID=7064 RepID=A0AAW1JFA6_POPJA